MFAASRAPILWLLLFGTALLPPRAGGYTFNGYRWPDGTDIVMHLQLNRPPIALQDGSASWNASAAAALSAWNQHLGTVRFTQGGSAQQGESDGINSVYFATTVYGYSFPTGAVAVTTYFSNGSGTFTETDVIFNNSSQWNSYRGPHQGTGANAVYDLRRVALHEFGHVLGLDHPNSQSVALMNAVIGDLDSLARDDIDGAAALYSPVALQATLGSRFEYPIPGAGSPTAPRPRASRPG